MLPEVSATVKAPVKPNMYKAVSVCYVILSSGYLMVSIAGYWAFGNAVTPYLPASFVGPTWAVRLSEFFALLQIVGCYQVGAWGWAEAGAARGRCLACGHSRCTAGASPPLPNPPTPACRSTPAPRTRRLS